MGNTFNWNVFNPYSWNVLKNKAMPKTFTCLVLVDAAFLVSACQYRVTFQGTPVIRITTVVGSHPAEWAGLAKMPRPLRNRSMGRSIHASAVVRDMTSYPAGNALVGLQKYK